MNTAGSDATLVRKVRTFADDMRRAEGTTASVVPKTSTPPKATASPTPPQAPSAAPTPPISSAPKVTPTPAAQIAIDEVATLQEKKSPPPAIHTTPSVAHTKALNVTRTKSTAPVLSADVLKAVEAVTPPTTSHLSDTKNHSFDIRHESGDKTPEATIVRDTRRKKWSLTSALGDAFSEWLGKNTRAVKNAVNPIPPKPQVPPPQTRVDTIAAARTRSTIAPRDDRSAVVEKLKTFAHDTERITGKPPVMPQASHASTPPRWGHTKDVAETVPQTPQATAPTPRPTPQMPKRSATPAPRGNADIAPPVTRSYESLVPPATTPAPQQPKIADKKRDAVIENLLAARIRSAATTQTQATPEPPPSRDIPFTAPVFTTEESAPLRTYRSDAIRDVESHKRTVPAIAAAEAARRPRRPAPPAQTVSARPFVIAGVLMMLIIAIGGSSIFWFAQRSPQDTGTIARIPTFIAINAQTPVQFSGNRADLLSALQTGITESTKVGVSQIYPTNDMESPAAVATSDFMYVLDPRAPGSFIRNLGDEMMFGAVGSAPYFILKTTSFDSAFAGMLEWEPFMSADFTPLFGSTVRRTLNTQSRTTDQTSTAYFVDDTVGNIDVRILYDESGAERIVYAFTDSRTLVITTSSAALGTLVEALK